VATRNEVSTGLDTRSIADLLDGLRDPAYVVDADGRVLFWNREAARVTGFEREAVVGVRCRDGGIEHVDACGHARCAAGCPIATALQRGRPHDADLWIHHCDGHRLPVAVKVTPLRDESGRIAGALQVFRDNSHPGPRADRLEELERLALPDPLTGLPNRRFIEGSLAARLDERARYGWGFGLLFMDLDHFKAVNDGHGHAAGDRLLQAVSGTLVANSRPFDVVGRWGGEEFVSIATHVDARQLRRIAERYRALVARSTIVVQGAVLGVTLSVGATLARPGDTMDAIVARADSLMYRCKARGRNRVAVGS
jgi:diguanylate cyclase (GGDEF)-like protein/PAS domain S-box-containing protein